VPGIAIVVRPAAGVPARGGATPAWLSSDWPQLGIVATEAALMYVAALATILTGHWLVSAGRYGALIASSPITGS
jgi:hypothetical protein